MFLVVLLVLFVALPATLALVGFNAFAASVLFYPAGFGLGWALIRLVTRSRRRFSWAIAAPVAAVGFVAASALLVAAGVIVDGVFGRHMAAPGGGGSGLAVGVLLGAMLSSGPEGRQGEVSEARDVRGLRGIRHWFFGPPVFSGNYVILGLMVLLSYPMLALVLFGIVHGSAHPVYFMLLAMGLGNIALGIAETLPLRPRGANAAMRVFFLLTVPVALSAFVLAVRQGS